MSDSSLSVLTTTQQQSKNPKAAPTTTTITPAVNSQSGASFNKDTVFTLKRWNLVAMWSWDVECEVCAICRTPLMGECLKIKSLI